MHLIMFDLDGTLVDSNAIDSQCYLQALVDVFSFDLDRIDRNSLINLIYSFDR
jgi:beta-phosphoglucomutase-like phosphatase (HAD superfamily)